MYFPTRISRLLLWIGLFFGAAIPLSLCAQTVAIGPFANREIEIPDSGEVRVVAAPQWADAYRWSNGWQTPTVFVSDSGWLWVDVTIDSVVRRDSMHFHHGQPCFQIPNTFWPNNEMYDCIPLRSDCELDTMHFRLFDRWGSEVYGSSDPQECWNGQSEDRPLPEGVYFYVFEWAIPDGYMRRRVGNITIVR